jgi:hypothetical protein
MMLYPSALSPNTCSSLQARLIIARSKNSLYLSSLERAQCLESACPQDVLVVKRGDGRPDERPYPEDPLHKK